MKQIYANLVDLDDVANRIDMHASRAVFILSIIQDETRKMNPETCEELDARMTLERYMRFSDVISDYLSILEDEATALCDLVETLFEDAKRKPPVDKNGMC